MAVQQYIMTWQDMAFLQKGTLYVKDSTAQSYCLSAAEFGDFAKESAEAGSSTTLAVYVSETESLS